MHIAALRLYPVKGLRGFDVAQATVQPLGLEGDRRWAIAAEHGKVLTQRDLPAMARIDAVLEDDGLRLECAGFGGITARSTETPHSIEVWGTTVPTCAANPEASAWLTRVLGQACTLVHQRDPLSRPVSAPAPPGATVSLADGYPLLVTSTTSLADLNRRLALPIPMDRFRPNLVVDGAEAWAEDDWAHVQAGPVRFHLPTPCSRCKVTTLDQQTGENPARTEPLKTLGTFHRDAEGRITFGWNAVPESCGIIHVGDQVIRLDP